MKKDRVLTYTSVSELVEAEFISQLGGVHSVGEILFVGKHQQHCISQLVLLKLPNTFKINDLHRYSAVLSLEKSD